MARQKRFGESANYAIGGKSFGTRPSRPCSFFGFFTVFSGVSGQVQVLVRDNNVDQALKALKKKLQREGVFREMKLRRHYEKPSERRAREAAEAVRRARKMERKRIEREGF
jgi:small subunit ribosomal protein S21